MISSHQIPNLSNWPISELYIAIPRDVRSNHISSSLIRYGTQHTSQGEDINSLLQLKSHSTFFPFPPVLIIKPLMC
jgi:hypothetical protein